MTPPKRIGMGLVGPGFIAPHHIDAVRRLGFVDVVALAGSSAESAASKARQFGVPRSYGSYLDLVADPEVHVVHNTTPSHLHLPVSLAALRAGKHVVSDKPLAMNLDESRQLVEAARLAGVINAVTFNYRGNPLVQEARLRVRTGGIGRVVFVQGRYLQDWMTEERVFSWRSDPAKGGVSSALADIGTHWCDLAQHICGEKITAVLADLSTVVGTRYRSEDASTPFAFDTSGAKQAVTVDAEDLAVILLRFENGAHGVMTAGQVLPGHKNDLEIEVNGRGASLRWQQERQNELWIGHFDQPNLLLAKDPALLAPEAKPYARLPGGHQEGWSDAFRNVIADIYEWIQLGVDAERPATVCTFAEATHTMAILDAMLESHAGGGVWKAVPHD